MSTAINHSSKREAGNKHSEMPRLHGSWFGNGYRWLQNPYALLDDGLREHGLSFYARLPLLGRVLISGDPEEIQAIVRCRELVGGRGTRALRPLLGDDALILLEGRRHTQRRKLLSAAFNRQSIRHCDHFIESCCLQELDALPRNGSFSIFDVARRITLRSVVRILFGQLDDSRERRLCDLINDYMASFSNPLFLFVKALQRDWGTFSPWGRLLLHRRRLRDFVFQEIDLHRRNGTGDTQSVLARMLAVAESADDSLSKETVFSEILSLLLFGHDTSAVTLGWAFYHLFSHADALEQLNAEVLRQADANRLMDDRRRSYLRCCILESMRLSPVVVHLTRVATRDLQIGRHGLKAGDKVLPSAYLAQHNAAVFDNPYAYDPSRFANGSNFGGSFFPFGFGKRKCIGEHLAMRQMQWIVYHFVRCGRLELEPEYRAEPERKMLLIGPSAGCPMRICRA